MITPEAKVMTPRFYAQYAFVFGAGATAANPYEVGTQAHASFIEEMTKLIAERDAGFTDATPEGMAFGDYVEGVVENPYRPGSEQFEQYAVAMEDLIKGELKS